jgi:Zn-dependent protease
MLHLGSIGKTTIDVDFSFIFLVGLLTVLSYNPAYGVHYALLLIPIAFISVLVHELAHAATIGLLGFGPSQIILGGMGGVTINQRRGKPWQNFLISVAGPLSSFALMYLSWAAWGTHLGQTDKFLVAFLPYMAVINKWWGIFNLLPVPPLDGGHATRDFFRMVLRNERNAFVIAIWIGMVVGAAVAVWLFAQGSFLGAFYLAWFVYMAYQQWVYFRQHGIPGD